MAFDHSAPHHQLEVIDWLAKEGVQRILTHGSSDNRPIIDNLECLQSYVKQANNRLIILPGGGVTALNAPNLLASLAINEAHGTKII
jgi:copper homeostasis protein